MLLAIWLSLVVPVPARPQLTPAAQSGQLFAFRP